MPNLRGYEQTYNKADMGLGIGGNPGANTVIKDNLYDSMDQYKNEITISPPQPAQPQKLTKQDILKIMTEE